MITKKLFGTLADGTAVCVYTMTSAANCTVSVLDLGVTVQSLLIPDRSGTLVDVVLGYDTPEAYMTNDGLHERTTVSFILQRRHQPSPRRRPGI